MSEQQSGEHDNEHADVTVILLSSEWERHAELDFVDFLFQCGGSEKLRRWRKCQVEVISVNRNIQHQTVFFLCV